MELEEIWSSYRNSLKAFLHSRVSNPADVEDLLQEVLIKTHSKIGGLKKEGSVKPWLFQVASRIVIDFYRHKGRADGLEAESLWYGENENDVKKELFTCIEPFLKGLPEDAANLLRLVDLEGKSQKAYAQELGISYSTLKSRVQKARLALRGLFEACCHYRLDKHGNIIDFERKPNACKNC